MAEGRDPAQAEEPHRQAIDFERGGLTPFAPPTPFLPVASLIEPLTPTTRRSPQDRPLEAAARVCHERGRGAPEWPPPARVSVSFGLIRNRHWATVVWISGGHDDYSPEAAATRARKSKWRSIARPRR